MSFLLQAKEILKAEAEVVKNAMGHGDLPLDAYSQVWEECYNQVSAGSLSICSQYTLLALDCLLH